ncbi:IS701 family transposase [Streptosporangium canum]
MHRIAHRFGRIEPRRTVTAYVRGLLADIDRKNCWNLAEQSGLSGPQAMQRLLRTARWDAEAVRDDVRTYAVEHLGQGGVLIVDETGFLKKGTGSAGVRRQYTGTAGKIDNSQVGVFLAYATTRGHALIDRRLYLPEHTWLADADRCRSAAVPDQAAFATKSVLAAQMIDAALRAGAGAKGPRFYLWAWARIDADRIGGHRWLLIRRHPATGELAFCRCYALSAMPLLSLVRIAGIRWAIEESFQAAKGQVGLDHYQVRSRIGWYRHITLAMLALVFLVAVAARRPDSAPEHIPLTMPEIRRLLAVLVLTRHRAIDEVLRWSQWRRRHQATARRCRYQRRFDHDLKMSLKY